MASASPSPNSPPSAVPPASSNSPPPLPSPPRSTPPEPSNAPPPQLNSPPPTITPPRQSSPPTNVAPPPPALTPPPVASSPPTASPPPQPTHSPPPANTSSSPPPPSIPPSSPPPPLPNPPASSPPPPLSNPPPSSPRPPPNPPSSSPPPPSNPPAISPSSSSTNPPLNSPPPLSSIPSASPPAPPKNDPPPGPPPPTKSPESSPPPPSSLPPVNSPPPPSSKPPESSRPQPAAKPPRKSPPPPVTISPESLPPQSALVSPPKSPPTFLTPPSRSPPASPPSSNSPQRSQPPPIVLTSSPPSVVSSPTNNNNSSTNAPESSQSRGAGGIGTGGTIAIVAVLVFLLLAIFSSVGWCIWKRKKKASGLAGGYIMPTSLGSSPKSDSTLLNVQISACINVNGSGRGFENSPREPGALGHSMSWFTYEELAEATNGFSGQNLLGEGGFGSVYKGCIADGRVVAVKQLKIDGGQGEREFRSEVEIISRIHHRHLVSLVGYCISENRRLLVYDYVPNNNLYFHLHGEGGPVMNWATRVRIAVGVARGIAYLHEDCHPRIIHRDIKSSNILLDNNFEARVSDFGLAKLAMDTSTHVTTRVMGTFGYMAPDYTTSGKLTEKSDVFSYGVVLLELITGRKPVDTSQPVGEESLVEWARPLLSHALEAEEFEGLADSRLEGNFVGSEMFRMIEAAAVCVRHSAAKRPKMGQVVRVFDGMATPDLTNGMKVGESAIFNSAQQSAEIRLFRRMAFGSQNYSTDFFSQNSCSNQGHQLNILM